MSDHKPGSQIRNIFNPASLVTVALLVATLFSGMMVYSVLADAPAQGTVVEGVSVPGLALGAMRTEVEAAYGEPNHCQDVEVNGDLAWCSYPVEGGNSVSVWYHGADGRYARNAQDDVVYQIRWPKGVSGWITTAGINTEIAFNDRQAVVDAYPNAKVTYNESGDISQVEDSQLGILVRWSEPVYIFPGSVSMTTYKPPVLLPQGDRIHVAGIDVTIDKYKSRRHVIAVVAVRGEQGQPVSGATVQMTWTYPKGTLWTVNEVTSYTGYAFFELYDARQGVWNLTVDDVLLDGHPFDRTNSQLSLSFRVK